MLEQATMSERLHDTIMDLRKSIDELTDEMKEINRKLPRSFEVDHLVKSVTKLASVMDKQGTS